MVGMPGRSCALAPILRLRERHLLLLGGRVNGLLGLLAGLCRPVVLLRQFQIGCPQLLVLVLLPLELRLSARLYNLALLLSAMNKEYLLQFWVPALGNDLSGLGFADLPRSK